MRTSTLVRITIFGFVVALQARSTEADEQPNAETQTIQPAEVKLDRPVDFDKDILPILEQNCIACHNVAIAENRLVLEDAENMLKGGKTGAAIVAGQPEDSLVFQFASRTKQPAMPPLPNEMDAKALTPHELGLLKQWLLEGARGSGAARRDHVQFQPIPGGRHAIYSVAAAPWGRWAAAGRANQVLVYDLATGEEAARLLDPALAPIEFEGRPMYPGGAAHRDLVQSLAFSPDGQLLASGGYRVVKLWKQSLDSTPLPVGADQPLTAVAVSADGKLVALAAADNEVRLVNLADGKPAATLSGHSARVAGLAFAPDGAKLFTASHDKTIRAWTVADGQPAGQLETAAAVNDVILNKDGTQLVSAHEDNVIRVWDLAAIHHEPEGSAPPENAEQADQPQDNEAIAHQETELPQPIRELKGHGQPVTSLALILPGGQQIVSGSKDQTVRIWNLANGEQVRSMNNGPITDVAARPDGGAVAAVGELSIARMWRTDNGQQLAEVKADIDLRRDLARKTEEQRVATELQNKAKGEADAADKDVKDREAARKSAEEARDKAAQALAEPQKKLDEANQALEAAKKELEAKPDDEGLKKKVADAQKAVNDAMAEVKKATDARDAAVKALELAEQAVARSKERLDEANRSKQAAEEYSNNVKQQVEESKKSDSEAPKPVRAVAFSPDGKLVVTAGDDHKLHVWGAADGKPLCTLSGHQAAVVALAFAGPRMVLSASADKTVVAWNLKPTWSLVARLGVKDDAPLDLGASPFENRVRALDFSDDGKLLVTGGGEPSRSGELLIWDVETREIAQNIKDAHSDTVLGVEFSRDGKHLLSGATDKFVKVFNVVDGTHVRSYEGHTHHVLDVSWKADGTQIVSAGADNEIKVWNAETGEQQRTIRGYGKQVTSIEFIGDGVNIASCGGDATVRLHRTNNGQNYRNFGGMPDYVYSVAVARDAETAINPNNNQDADVILAGGEDGTLRVWNVANGQQLFAFEPPKVEDNTQASAASSQ